ncbi:acyl-CoA dehydrogenase family protein [Nocardia sp. NPDC019304]|uniref:acyl-CoA dehydrogenase family protein n=1 Tax=unclassified Nocardia TaxID=2637762 RepID=UPI0033DD350D
MLDAPRADRLLVPARAPSGEVVIVAVEPGVPGATVTARPVVDATRDLGRVGAGGVVAFPRRRRARTRRQCDRPAIATACDSLGLSRAMPAATVGYAGVREQFVRPIGSCQAVKRACADLLVRIAVAGQLVAAAVRAEVASGPDAGGAASRAKAFTPETAVRVAGKAMQLHGRMVTCGRAGSTPIASEPRSIGVMFGTPAEHRRRLARRFAPA